MIRVACPKCAKPLGLPDAVAGKPIKCPSCHQPFIAPKKSGPAPTQAKAPPKPAEGTDEFDTPTPYGIQQDPEQPQLALNAQSEAVDEMVITARRQRKRNKAWEFVGYPAKFIKRAALSAVIFWIVLYVFLTVIIVLANHNMEQLEASGGKVATRGGQPDLPKYLFVQDVFPMLKPQTVRPIVFWLVITGGFIAAMMIYGLQLAGAESMKKLEGYPLSVFAMIVGTLSLNLFGIWGLLALMNKDVQYEFRVSKRRAQGISGEELYDEEGDEELDQEEDEEIEEEESRLPARARK